MRGFRAVFVTLACVMAGLVGMAGATLAEPGASGPAVMQPALVRPAPFSPAVVAPEPLLGAPRTSIATRHVPTPAESALTGALHPATDRLMTLLIAWILVVLVGGGMLAGRGRGSRLERRLEH